MPRLAHHLQLREIRLILAIRETGQLSTAAERLAISQPAASRMLSRIEQRLGLPVFTRTPKGMAATLVGEILARNAVGLLNGLEQTLLEVGEIASGRGGSARVGAVSGGAVTFVVPAIRQLREAMGGGADIYVDVAPSDALIDGLVRRDYDFVLSRLPPGVDVRPFTVLAGRPEQVRFVVRAAHPCARVRQPEAAALARYEWVVQAPHTPLRQTVEEWLALQQVPAPRQVINTASLLVTLAYLTASDAVAVVSEEIAGLLAPAGSEARLRVLDVPAAPSVAAYHLVTRRDQSLSPLAERLRQLVAGAIAGAR